MTGLIIALRVLVSLLIVLATAWGGAALWYQLPLGPVGKYSLMLLWGVLALAMLVIFWRGWPWLAVGGFVLAFCVLQLWWSSLQPSNDRAWAEDLSQMTYGEVKGNQVTLHNVRNFNWRSDEDFDARWETRHYDLQKLKSVDMVTSYWGMPAIAHVLVSFGFEDGQFVVFSVEIRKEKGEEYSEIGGFFKVFELSIVATDERDSIRVRSHVRGEDVYLYRTRLTPEDGRTLFLSYIEQANELQRNPRFYNTVTANCTTLVFSMMRQIVQGLPMDYRLLLSGYLPSYVEDAGGLQSGFSLDQLRQRGRITERAQQAGANPEFSRLIRKGVPGWEALDVQAADKAKVD